MNPLLDRITIDPLLCHGKPCIRGLRYPVEMLLGLLSGGMTFDEILADYEDLESDDLLAVIAFEAQLVRGLPRLTLDQRAELHRRDRELDTNPGNGLTWEQIRSNVERIPEADIDS